MQQSLLIASPSLNDHLFTRSVIYIYQYSKALGAEGLILNSCTDKYVGNIFNKPELKALHKVPIHCGGPVDTENLTFSSFVFSPPNNPGTIQCNIGISIEEALETSLVKQSSIRAFVGKSVWIKGQLEDEIKHQSWYLAPPIKEAFTLPQDQTLWQNTLQCLSPFHHLISLTPDNPFLN